MALYWAVDNECAKNVTKFRRVRVPVRSVERRQASQPVNVNTNNDQKGPYKYLVKTADSPPQIRIVLPGLVIVQLKFCFNFF